MHFKKVIAIVVCAAIALGIPIIAFAQANGQSEAESTPDSYLPVISAARTAAKTAAIKTSHTKKAPAGSTPTTLRLKPHDFSMGVGETCKLTAETDVETLPDDLKLQFESNNPQVAEVGSDGKVYAHKTGAATITCRCGKLTDSCTLSVSPAATALTLNFKQVTLGIGETLNLNSHVNKGAAAYTREYQSSDEDVAYVTKYKGVVTARKVGSATIECVLQNGVKATCALTVKPMPESVTLNATALEMEAGSTFDINSSIPEGTAAFRRTYRSDNPTIASVHETNGVITAVGSGTTRITCLLENGVSAAVTVSVTGSVGDPIRVAMVEQLRGQVGKHNDSFIAYINERGDFGLETDFPWCAVFAWSNLDQFCTSVGRKNPIEACFYVSDIAMQAQKLGALKNVNDHDYIPKPGDLFTTCCVERPGDDGRDHIGYVESVERDSDGKVTKVHTIEGNFAWETDDSDTTKVWRGEWVPGVEDEYGSSICEFIDLEKLLS